LVPSDFRLFGLLKNQFGCKRFADDEEVEAEVWSSWDNIQKNSMLRVLTHW
jgi:hypothetical protein